MAIVPFSRNLPQLALPSIAHCPKKSHSFSGGKPQKSLPVEPMETQREPERISD